jgi:hypothetical protein
MTDGEVGCLVVMCCYLWSQFVTFASIMARKIEDESMGPSLIKFLDETRLITQQLAYCTCVILSERHRVSGFDTAGK